MNAAEQVNSVAFAHALASSITLVRQQFPSAFVNLSPWRDDPETRRWCQEETMDLAFHFPGWSPKLQCRSLLLQLIMNQTGDTTTLPHLLGVLIRGMTFDGERWRLATLGDWQPTGQHLPAPGQIDQLHSICRDLFALFPPSSPLLDAS